MSLTSLSEIAEHDASKVGQALLYPLDTIPVLEFEPFSKPMIGPADCYSILGLETNGRRQPYTHVIRQIAHSCPEIAVPDNEPHRGRDKLVFFNFDTHGKFHWQAVYSSALFLGDDYRIIVP